MDCFEDIEEKDQEELRKLFTGPDENKEKADDEEDSKERLEALKVCLLFMTKSIKVFRSKPNSFGKLVKTSFPPWTATKH